MTHESGEPEIETLFLDDEAGRLLVVRFHPESPGDRAVVFCPPFAEEMNKSRRMMALTASRLAAKGVTTVLVDLVGTGDSSGEFGDARWSDWQQNVDCVLQWLAREGNYSVTLCGVRLGAALAIDAATRSESSVRGIVLWQPVVSGSTFLTQFLRIRVAAEFNALDRTGTDVLRERALNGESLEIAGYEISSDMFKMIDTLDLRKLKVRQDIPIHWLEIVSESRPRISPVSERAISSWREMNVNISGGTVIGDPFWATAELALAPALIDKTVEICG
jgi:exosortase A-associated hydrolase 2